MNKIKKILFLAANTRSLIANRGDLIRQMKADGHKVHALVPSYDFLKEIETLGIPYDVIDFNRTGLNPIKDYQTFKELKRYICNIKPDVVFSYAIKPVIYGTLAAKSCGVPIKSAMITGMGYLFTGNSLKQIVFRNIASFLYKISLRSAQAIFFQNPDDL